MATQTITLSIPEEVAAQFFESVPVEEQPALVADALKRILVIREERKRWEAEMIASCDALNADPVVAELVQDMDSLSGDGLDEYPWDVPAAR